MSKPTIIKFKSTLQRAQLSQLIRQFNGIIHDFKENNDRITGYFIVDVQFESSEISKNFMNALEKLTKIVNNPDF